MMPQPGGSYPPPAPPRRPPASWAPAPPPRQGGGARPASPLRWGRRLRALLVVLAVLVLGSGIYVDTQLTRAAALADYTGRPDSDGTNWLIVGSDSRADLTEQQEATLSTGNAAGQRTDTVMLLHTGSSGTTLVSLPRDSLLSIPGHGKNKLNSAYSFGGPKLLTRTVEQATGLRIDHYAEIGFDGFVNVVDAVGGVDMCIPEAMKDPKAGLNIKAGCQRLDGQNALGYVRTRATPRADLDRVQHQREFLSALMKQVVSPATLVNPFRMVGLVRAMPGAITVDSGDHVWNLVWLALAMHELSGSDGVTTTVPIGGLGTVNGSSVVRWDAARAKQLFSALAKDEPAPKSTLG
ncbi:LCP family protein [Pseudonocardia sp.]|uniref:LCP family protein n=1 Tax=Pseudonocardia sp. TaxID=60912 RepID=UPI0039C9C7D8